MEILSKTNPKIKEYIKLRDKKKYRYESGFFVIEGLKSVVEASVYGEVISLFYTEDAAQKSEISALVCSISESFKISYEVAEKLADTKEWQGVFAVCKMPKFDFKPNRDSRVLLLQKLQDPGNMGTILRTAAAFNIDAVYLCCCVDNYSPKVVRSSAGAIFKIPTIIEDEFRAIESFKEQGIAVYGAALGDESEKLDSSMFSGGCCVCIGNEGQGLTDEILQQVEKRVIIPMGSESESLNAAVAASIFLWEMRR